MFPDASVQVYWLDMNPSRGLERVNRPDGAVVTTGSRPSESVGVLLAITAIGVVVDVCVRGAAVDGAQVGGSVSTIAMLGSSVGDTEGLLVPTPVGERVGS